MKYFYSFLIAFFILLNTNAQITLENTDLPSLGDIIYLANPTDIGNIDVGIASNSNQTWDFSNLIPQNIDTLNFISIAGTAAELTFQNSDMATINDFEELFGFNLGGNLGTGCNCLSF